MDNRAGSKDTSNCHANLCITSSGKCLNINMPEMEQQPKWSTEIKRQKPLSSAARPRGLT
jgi:hypothetical protein